MIAHSDDRYLLAAVLLRESLFQEAVGAGEFDDDRHDAVCEQASSLDNVIVKIGAETARGFLAKLEILKQHVEWNAVPGDKIFLPLMLSILEDAAKLFEHERGDAEVGG